MNYTLLKDNIANTHRVFQDRTVKAINTFLTLRNWVIGFYIVEFQQRGEERAEYGSQLLERLSKELNIKGLSAPELSRCRQFYLVYAYLGAEIKDLIQTSFPKKTLGTLPQEFENYSSDRNLGTLSQELTTPAGVIIRNLSYSHLTELIKIDDPLKRAFYELECIKGSWGVRELKRQISSLYFERSGLSKQPEKLSLLIQEKVEKTSPGEIIKSVYALEFLGLNPESALTEKNFEKALIDHLQSFILELGNGFCFEARQKRILIDDEYYFADLVFYHRILKCHVIIELKTDAFSPAYLAQLNTYVSYYNDKIKQKDDNPAIGILMCTHAGSKLVEYALAGMDNQLFISKYLLELPDREVLEEFIRNDLKYRK